MRLRALWHDLECGDYADDLPLWRALAAEALGPVLDVGAGTGRVSLELAAGGVPVVALSPCGGNGSPSSSLRVSRSPNSTLLFCSPAKLSGIARPPSSSSTSASPQPPLPPPRGSW